MLELLRKLHKEEAGQDIVEYVLIGGFISVVAITTTKTVGNSVSSLWTTISTALQ